ncbi:methyl-accepting chemotaxis protein [Caballeronia sp. SEWSISQ10-4 2]|uniref:methyl-accepting chemotaxis protein n=1 Tax=Caballeronia sp. SEWSISQ10-4 2 TaxID=2937438 RepID=UPI00264BC488|nr:methyl-accepting chemotaxis protein [Caballeronia sp. SEWSISQ10-4 2]MDN7177263.1 methyl-accepting chemotaxis protein [Caballeronia sp. SEWSISQ10-4 2]
MLSSIRIRILVTCIAIVIAALAITGVINWLVASSFNQKSIDENISAISAGHALAISDWIQGKSRMVASIAPAQLDGDTTTAVTQLKLGGGFSGAYVGYSDKRATFSAGNPSPAAGYDPTVRPWYKQAVEAGKLTVTKPYMASSLHKLVVTFARPILIDGTLTGVVGADIPLDTVSANVNAIHPTPNSFAFVTDHSGIIIAHPDANLSLKAATDLAPGLTAQTLNMLADASQPLAVVIGGVTKLLHAERIDGTDWELIIALDESDVTAGMHAAAIADFISVLVVTLAASLLLGALTAPPFKRLSQARDAMQVIGSGSGDLTRRLPMVGNDEVAAIARSFNLFVDKMTSTLVEIRNSTESVKTAAVEISQGNQDLSARTEHAASSLQQTAASMEEIHGTVRQSAESATHANRLASAASDVATRGGAVVDEVVSTMEAISDSSKKISDIIAVIDSIAFQTNILALNAAVEAARAGEQGRGFAVVAGEVRTLAQRSAQAAKEIKLLIIDSVSKVQSGSDLVSTAGDTMRELVKSVQQVSGIIAEITVAAGEQSTGIGQVNQAVTQLDEVTQQNASLVEEVSATAGSLKDQSIKLAEVVGRFRLTAKTPSH